MGKPGANWVRFKESAIGPWHLPACVVERSHFRLDGRRADSTLAELVLETSEAHVRTVFQLAGSRDGKVAVNCGRRKRVYTEEFRYLILCLLSVQNKVRSGSSEAVAGRPCLAASRVAQCIVRQPRVEPTTHQTLNDLFETKLRQFANDGARHEPLLCCLLSRQEALIPSYRSFRINDKKRDSRIWDSQARDFSVVRKLLSLL